MNLPALLLAGLAFAQESRTDEESGIRARIDGLGRAMASGDRAKILACFDLPRMIKELDAHGGRAFLPEGDGEREAVMNRLKAALPAMATGAAAFGAPWEKIRTLSVKTRRDGQEAEAFCHVTLGGTRSKFRFFLAQEKGEWKVYDFEMLEFGLRFSLTLGALGSAGEAEGASRRMQKALVALLRSVKLLSEAEFEKAREALAAARAAEPPGTIAAWVDLLDAMALVALDENEHAIKAADRALAAQKDLALAHLLKAGAFSAMEEDEKAIASAREFIGLVGDDPDSWGLIGEAYERLDQLDRAIEAFGKGAASDEDDFSNRLNLGRLLLQGGRTAEARPQLLAASRNAPPDELASLEAAELLGAAGEHQAVLDLAEEFARRAPEDGSLVVWHARALRRLLRPEEAEKVVRAGLGKEPDDFELLEERVLALAQAGKDEEAQKALKELEDDDPEGGRFARIFLHALADRPAKALPDLQELLEEDESEVERIVIEPALKRFREQAEVRAVLDPARATHEFMTAVRKLRKDDWPGMAKLAADRLAVAPQHDYAHYYQGYALRRLKRFEEAVTSLRHAVAKAKNPQSFRDELGRALAATDRLDDALFEADQLRSNGAEEEGMALRVAVYALAKKPDLALQALGEFLKEYPDWHTVVGSDRDLEELRKLPACQELLRKAKE